LTRLLDHLVSAGASAEFQARYLGTTTIQIIIAIASTPVRADDNAQ
jgi:hypothetical protein